MVEMTLHPDGVVVVVETNPGVRHTAESMHDDVVAFRELTDNRVLPALWDVRAMDRPTPDAWREFINDISGVLSALAILVDDRTRQITGAYQWAMDSFLFPSGFFEDESSAYDWLLQFVPPRFSLDVSGEGTAST
jgi:hypothetical protein